LAVFWFPVLADSYRRLEDSDLDTNRLEGLRESLQCYEQPVMSSPLKDVSVVGLFPFLAAQLREKLIQFGGFVSIPDNILLLETQV
jgi:hypothetical protein